MSDFRLNATVVEETVEESSMPIIESVDVTCMSCGTIVCSGIAVSGPVYCSSCYNKAVEIKPLSKLSKELEKANSKQKDLMDEEIKAMRDRMSQELEEYKREVDSEYELKEENLLSAFKAIREFIDLSMKNVK